ncbi:MAG TPA: FadD3 family acyl-CoA ligase [Myxococcota bacterium]|nr:FadD3 family acyl-CoA ligase [Myxococcota bacterium]
MTIPRALARAAALWPHASAVEDGATRLTFAQLAAEVERASRALLAAGVAHGDRVAVWAPNSWQWEVAALGAQCAGAVLVTLNTRFKAHEAAFALSKGGARVLFTVGEFLGINYAESLVGQQLPKLERRVTLVGSAQNAQRWSDFLAGGESVTEDAARARAAAVTPDDICDVIFTSGTTGFPKGVMTAHGQNLEVFDTWSRGVGLRAGDRYLIVSPYFHSMGYKAGWLACLIRGATALPHAVFDVPAVLARIGREKVNVLPGAPTLYQSILAHPDRAKYDLSCLRLAVTGAAPVPVELVHRMKRELGFETVITAYGLTESTGTVSMCTPDDDAETISTTSGKAIPNTEVKCVRADGSEAPRGEPGEVWVRGYNVMRGYFEDPAETAKAIDADGWLHTGDVAVMDERGYLRITDRIKDMYIYGGFNCYPAEIENLIYKHPGVAQVAVIGVPHERQGEIGMAFVVPRPGAALEPDALIGWCRNNMANYKVPGSVRILSALPQNASGKVLKTELRKLAAAEGA